MRVGKLRPAQRASVRTGTGTLASDPTGLSLVRLTAGPQDSRLVHLITYLRTGPTQTLSQGCGAGEGKETPILAWGVWGAGAGSGHLFPALHPVAHASSLKSAMGRVCTPWTLAKATHQGTSDARPGVGGMGGTVEVAFGSWHHGEPHGAYKPVLWLPSGLGVWGDGRSVFRAGGTWTTLAGNQVGLRAAQGLGQSQSGGVPGRPASSLLCCLTTVPTHPPVLPPPTHPLATWGCTKCGLKVL